MAIDPRVAPAVSVVFICYHLAEVRSLAPRRAQSSDMGWDGRGQVLLARRGAGARDEPGTWDAGAGALEHGESFADAVRREVREEYTADALDIETIGVRNILRGESHWVAVVNAVRVDPEAVAIGEPHKFDELGWFALDALPFPLHSQLPATVDLFREWAGAPTR